MTQQKKTGAAPDEKMILNVEVESFIKILHAEQPNLSFTDGQFQEAFEWMARNENTLTPLERPRGLNRPKVPPNIRKQTPNNRPKKQKINAPKHDKSKKTIPNQKSNQQMSKQINK